MQREHSLRLRTGPDDRLPVLVEDRRQTLAVRLLGDRDGLEAALRVAADLRGAGLGLGEVLAGAGVEALGAPATLFCAAAAIIVPTAAVLLVPEVRQLRNAK